MNKVNLSTAPDLFIVEFPGIVKNTDKALQIIESNRLAKDITKANCNPELYWRQGDDFGKPVDGERVSRRRKIVLRVKKSSGKLTVCLIGVVRFEVKYTSLASCQYLPVAKDESSGAYNSIQMSLLPIDLSNYNFLGNFETPLFMVPPMFHRSNRQPFTFYRCKTLGEVLSIECEDFDKYDNLRGNRSVNWFTVKFGDPIPSIEKHSKEISNTLSVDFPEVFNFVKKIFEERPIWSTTSVKWRFSNTFKGVINASRMLSFLGQVAYYIENGPWQRLWCRLGYDPSQNPTEAKTFQVVDFRLSRSILKSRAFSTKLVNKPRGSHTFSQVSSVNKVLDPPHVFRAGNAPMLACTYFQVCDIQLEEIQRLIHSNDGQEPLLCHRIDGFLIKDYGNIFRRLMIATLLPADKVQKFMDNDMNPFRNKKKKRYKPLHKKAKGESSGDTVKNYISTVGATLGVVGEEDSDDDSSSESDVNEEMILDDDVSDESIEDEEEDDDNEDTEMVAESFMKDVFPDQGAADHERVQQLAGASSTNTDSRPGSADLRRLWQDTATIAADSGDGESTLDFPQL